MPFFCRHSRIAAKRPAFGPLAPVVVVAGADALVVLEEEPDELPHAARPRQASSRTSTAAVLTAGLRLLLLR
jgi:hypothetical protein